MATRRRSCTPLAALALAALTLTGTSCAVLNFGEVGHEGGDATLGQAASTAADTTKKDRPLDVGYTTPPEGEVSAEVGGTAYAEPTEPGQRLQKPPPDPFQRPVFGLVGHIGSLGGDSYDGFGGIGLTAGGYPAERLRLDLIARAGYVDFVGRARRSRPPMTSISNS
jgi:hypothetical protein